MKKIISIILVLAFLTGGVFAEDKEKKEAFKIEMSKRSPTDKTAVVIISGLIITTIGLSMRDIFMGEYKKD